MIQHQAQQAIAPQALALGAFGVLAALAMLVLTGQGVAYLFSQGQVAGADLVQAHRRHAGAGGTRYRGAAPTAGSATAAGGGRGWRWRERSRCLSPRPGG